MVLPPPSGIPEASCIGISTSWDLGWHDLQTREVYIYSVAYCVSVPDKKKLGAGEVCSVVQHVQRGREREISMMQL